MAKLSHAMRSFLEIRNQSTGTLWQMVDAMMYYFAFKRPAQSIACKSKRKSMRFLGLTDVLRVGLLF